MTPPIIYNLFQRLVGPTTKWAEHAGRAQQMGFNWLYINPWHYPGFSGSLYAPKELRRLNPLFLPPGADPESLQPLREFLREMKELRMPVLMDLVINHTSKDSPLTREHPDWFVRDSHGQVVSPSVTDPDDPSKVTTWGDLAEIDNEHSPDRRRLWGYWVSLVRESIELGFDGFRCDAAYMVPADLWRLLIEEARALNPRAVFMAETLGAKVEAVLALREAGFDYFFNSSKWWNFREPWALDQHEKFGAVAPSISFPETHDTSRVAGDTNGDVAIQKQRYAFAAAFSAGLMMPIGYEFGFRRQVHVVETMPSHWERKSFDLRPFITRVNRLKTESRALQGESHLSTPRGLGDDVLVLARETPDAGRAFVLVNTDPNLAREVELASLSSDGNTLRLHRVCGENAAEDGVDPPPRLVLDRAEVAYLLPVAN